MSLNDFQAILAAINTPEFKIAAVGGVVTWGAMVIKVVRRGAPKWSYLVEVENFEPTRVIDHTGEAIE